MANYFGSIDARLVLVYVLDVDKRTIIPPHRGPSLRAKSLQPTKYLCGTYGARSSKVSLDSSCIAA